MAGVNGGVSHGPALMNLEYFTGGRLWSPGRFRQDLRAEHPHRIVGGHRANFIDQARSEFGPAPGKEPNRFMIGMLSKEGLDFFGIELQLLLKGKEIWTRLKARGSWISGGIVPANFAGVGKDLPCAVDPGHGRQKQTAMKDSVHWRLPSFSSWGGSKRCKNIRPIHWSILKGL